MEGHGLTPGTEGTGEGNPEFRITASRGLASLVASLEACSPFSHLPDRISARDSATALKWALEEMELEWFYILDGEFVQVVGPDSSATHYFVRNPRFPSLEGRFVHHGVEMVGSYETVGTYVDETGLLLIDRYIEVRVVGQEDRPGMALTPFMPDPVVDDLLSFVNPQERSQ